MFVIIQISFLLKYISSISKCLKEFIKLKFSQEELKALKEQMARYFRHFILLYLHFHLFFLEIVKISMVLFYLMRC